MKSNNCKLFGVLLLISMFAVLFLISGTALAKDKVYTIRIQSMYPAGDLSFDVLPEFAKAVERRSNGRLKVKIYADGELYPGKDSLNACLSGGVEMAQGSGNLFGQIQPMGSIEFGLPYALAAPNVEGFIAKGEAIRDFFYSSGMVDLIRMEYAKKGLFYLGPNTFGTAPVTMSRAPVNKCSDLKGKVVRAGGVFIEYHAAVGMKGANINPMEAYMALKMGTVDLSDYDVSCITGLKWHEVAPYWIRGMENDHILGTMIVNLKWWKSLPLDLQYAVLNAHHIDYWNACLYGYNRDMAKAMALVKEGKVIINNLPQDCVDKYKQKAMEMWDAEAKKGPSNAIAVHLLKEWHGVE